MLRRPEIRIADRRGVEVIIGYLRLVSRKSGRVIHTRQIIFRGNTGIIPDILGHGQPCEDISPDHNVRLVNVINRIVRHLDLKPGRLECLRPVPAVDQVVLQRRFGIKYVVIQTNQLLRMRVLRFGRIERLVGDGHLHDRIPEIDTLEILRIVRIVNHIVDGIHGTILDMQRRIIGGIGRRKEVVIARSRDMQVLESRIVLATQFRPGDRRLRTFGITADQHDVAHIDRRARNRERQIGSIGVVDENQTSGRNDRSGQFGGLEQLRFRIDRLIDRQVAQRDVFPVLIILIVVRLGGNGSRRRRVPDACHLARQITGIGDHVDRIGRIGFEVPDRHARTRTGRAFGKNPGGVGSRFRRFEAEVFPAVGIGRGRNVEGQRRLRVDLTSKEELFNKVSFFVRKTGHFSEYGILAGLILILLFTFEEVRNTRKHIIMGAVVTDLICMIYASTDEFHQTFVDGRSGKSADVLIDTSGTVFATIILCLIIVCAGNRRRKNEQLER